MTKITCVICGQPAFVNARGEVLAHTAAAEGGMPNSGNWWARPASYKPAEVCSSYKPGVRP